MRIVHRCLLITSTRIFKYYIYNYYYYYLQLLFLLVITSLNLKIDKNQKYIQSDLLQCKKPSSYSILKGFTHLFLFQLVLCFSVRVAELSGFYNSYFQYYSVKASYNRYPLFTFSFFQLCKYAVKLLDGRMQINSEALLVSLKTQKYSFVN